MARGGSSTKLIPDIIKQTLDNFADNPSKSDKIHSDIGNAQSAFENVERKLPGFTQDFLRGFMRRVGMNEFVDIDEMCLRLSAMDTGIPTYTSNIPHAQELEKHASELKVVLSRIPTEIVRRPEFIDVIKQIASAIKNLLDCMNLVISSLVEGAMKQDLDDLMRNFVEYSRRFSSALKNYFRDARTAELYASANFLVQHTNWILLYIRTPR